MSSDVQLPVYVINLARSVERWQAIHQSALDHNVSITRVDAVDGRAIAQDDWEDVDIKQFGRRNGRSVLPGEYGCYQSHFRALETFLASGLPQAVIMEDDIEFVPDFDAKVRAILDCVPKNAVVKLMHHRCGGFIRTATTQHGVLIGACAFGPEGSSAAYALSRDAAKILLVKLKPMSLPFDVALGRGWAMGLAIYNLRHNLLTFFENGYSGSSVVSDGGYGAIKWKKWRRIPAYLFRAHENNRRILHALQCRLFSQSPKAPL